MTDFYKKYLKYKNKYNNLKQNGGVASASASASTNARAVPLLEDALNYPIGLYHWYDHPHIDAIIRKEERERLQPDLFPPDVDVEENMLIIMRVVQSPNLVYIWLYVPQHETVGQFKDRFAAAHPRDRIHLYRRGEIRQMPYGTPQEIINTEPIYRDGGKHIVIEVY
jgi:hypothetical protein